METALSDESLLREVRLIFRDCLGRDDASSINAETLFFADLGLASIDAVVLGEALQAHYNQLLPFGDLMADMGSRDSRDLRIADLLSFLRKNLGE